ncbi:hypothetical protein, partial [Burkholderia vietnamiensis]|uniref:hypothetical protein n=1 Tax=Burkholderia vietnamiensis TaxID=60552 RepID=UPI002DD4277E
PMSWSPNSTRTDKEIYNRHCATPKPAESVTFPKSAVTFAEIRNYNEDRSAAQVWRKPLDKIVHPILPAFFVEIVRILSPVPP